MPISANQQSGKLPGTPKESPMDGSDGNPLWWRKSWRDWLNHLKPVIDSIAPQPPPPPSPPPALSIEAAIAEAVARAVSSQPNVSRETLLSSLQGLLMPNAAHFVDQTARDLADAANSRVILPIRSVPEILVCTQATFPVLAGTSPTFVYVSDFAHMIYWDGTAASFADGGSDFYIIAQSVPSAIGWHAVDGSTVSFLNADGTLTSKTLKTVSSQKTYLAVGSGADTLNAPTADVFTGTPGTPAGTIASTFTGSAQTFTTTPTLAGAGVNAFTAPNPYTPAGSVSSVFTGAGSTPAGTIAAGEPENFYSALWFRL